MVEVNRRDFLVGTGLAAIGVLAEDDKIVDGGFSEVTPPGVPTRKTPVLPPGSGNLLAFMRKCVGCQLCVQQCPNQVLRASRDPKRLLQPEMGFEHGYCRPECTKCGEVCPAGAIRPVKAARKRHVHVGQAVWHKDRCLAAAEGVMCDACVRHCPVQAIVHVKAEDGTRVPVVDRMTCIGCGACEHLCPARPLPAMTVEGLEIHREVKPMGDADVLAEAKRLFDTGKAAVVMVRDGVIAASENGRGLSPLLDLCDRGPEVAKGAWVIDKVIGKAAASVCVAFGVSRVHGALMCEPAVALLKAHGVPCSSDRLVPQILNRDKSGLCPLEATVKDLSDVPEMVQALRARIAQFKAAAARKPPRP